VNGLEPKLGNIMFVDRDRSLSPAVEVLGDLTPPNNQANSAAQAAPGILVSIPSGFQLRQFVHSGLVDLLIRRGVKILILSPSTQNDEWVSHYPPGAVKVLPLEFQFGPLRRRYWAARQHLLLDRPMTETLRQKQVDLRRRFPWMAPAVQVANRALRLLPPVRHGVLRWERLFLSEKTVENVLSTQSIDLVLVGSPGYFEQDAILLHAATRRRIPVAAAVLSWDNLSSKGLINPQPDRLFVWSDHMRQEAITLQGVPPERIFETGSTVHDAFANTERFGSRSENLRRLGLDPERRLIVYGTNHGGSFWNEVEVVKRVAEWVEKDELGNDCQLWIRIHPQAVRGVYAIRGEAYRDLISKRVIVEFPPVRDANLPWQLPKSDLQHLVSLLRDADVVINSGSLSIDAAILDRPVICVAFDSCGDAPYDQSVRRYYDYTHLAHVVKANAVQLAHSPEELRQKIKDYLNDPTLDREGRRRIVRQQFGRVDGKSANRLLAAVLEMLSSNSLHSANRHSRYKDGRISARNVPVLIIQN
jgi:CDP-glycerol:poly(glycerophosphate) glycerophosphotransferase